MARIDVVPVMTKAPAKCLVCSTTPMKIDGEPKRAIDLNTDVDWGQNAYLCAECTRVICELWGWVSEEDFDRLRQEYADLIVRHKKLKGRYNRLKDRAQAIVAGKKAERKVKRKKAA